MDSGLFAFVAIVGMIGILSTLLTLVTAWKVFEKYGEPGWKGLIPFYSSYVEFGHIWSLNAGLLFIALNAISNFIARSEQQGIVNFISLLVSVLYFLMKILYAKKKSQAFGGGIGLALVVFFFPFIANLVIGFGGARYLGNPTDPNSLY